MKERQGRGASLSSAGKRRRGRRRVLGDAGEASTREAELGRRRGKGEVPLLLSALVIAAFLCLQPSLRSSTTNYSQRVVAFF